MLRLFHLFLINGIWFASYGKQNAEYELVWSDEFNGKGKPDSSKWNYE